MHINANTLKFPSQKAYSFRGGRVDTDPVAFCHFVGSHNVSRSLSSPYVRAAQKAKRLSRLAARSAKSRRWEN